MMKKLSLTTVAFFMIFCVIAQQDFIMYNLRNVPQSIYSNPSNRFNGKFYIGLPALSSNYFSLSNSGFAYSDAFEERNGDLYLDFDNLINTMEDNNYLSFNLKVDLLSFGFNINDRTQLTVNVTENANFRLTYNKDLFRFIYKGNAGFGSSEANFEGLGLNLNHYREYGIGVSHQLTKKLRLGIKGKYLYGMENIYSEESNIKIQTDPQTFAIKGSADLTLRTTGFQEVDENEGAMEYFSGRDNKGWGLDFGANYELNEKWSFNASVIDIGYITWKDYTKSYSNDGEPYNYRGVDIDILDAQSPGDETSFDRVLDSLQEAFNLVEKEGEEYKSALASRIYMGANYKLNDQTVAGGILHTEFFQGDIRPALSLNINRQMTKWISLSAAYTLINRSYNNLGLGLVLDPGPVQFYIVSDNVLGAIQPQHARHAQVRFGLNLIFGRTKTKEFHTHFHGVIPNKSSDASEEGNSDSEAPPANEE
ncbi:MAG: hypothetical protein CMO34_00405 [Verrucomicrobia bacterium]|nr:hypothetical protein [Verrucomicrobiota bacterium]|tara:strand:+ start:396 stop:1832 length:1437 start_codon:yes stop_codon:yes gene_type:complete